MDRDLVPTADFKPATLLMDFVSLLLFGSWRCTLLPWLNCYVGSLSMVYVSAPIFPGVAGCMTYRGQCGDWTMS